MQSEAKFKLCASLLSIAILTAGCTHPRAIETVDNIRLTPLESISTFKARLMLSLAGVKDVHVSNSVDLYRMNYSMRIEGKTVELSGLLALPRDVQPIRLVSFQHGTTTTKSAVPSKPDGTGIAAAIVFAGIGYALIAPDYPGLGESQGRHPYYVAESIGPSVVAMIESANRLKMIPNKPVFLSGFSEGGWASFAALRILEQRTESVFGSAQVAGPYDLRNISLPATLRGNALSHSLYLAYAAWGQSDYYHHPLDSVLTPEYARVVDRVFNGAQPKEILRALPSDPKLLFNHDVLDAFDRNTHHWYLDAFAANSLSDYAPRAPVRLYYGSKDIDVIPDEALSAAKKMQARGSNAIAIDVGPVTHDESMLKAAPLILAWLRELETAVK